MDTFISDGLNLAYDDIPGGGAGTVVLVHGFATNAEENWRRLGWYGAFERRGARVVALDLRGHGRSDKPHDVSAYGLEGMAADIVALMDHLDIGRADLMGYSLGARLAARTAVAHPDRVENLILGGVGARLLEPRAIEPGKMTMAEAMRAPAADAVTDATLRGFRQFAENQGEDRLALAACSECLAASIARVDFDAIRAPTLVVAGARDELAGSPDVLAAVVPDAKAVTLPGCDHFSAIPHALFKAAVFDFLDGWEEEV
jgi:pimeloyl-ACP methyl ester carboxylesterase